MTSDEGMEAALFDVRKAYRLLYLYQRRALDLCDEVIAVLNAGLKTSLEFRWWGSNCGTTPMRGTNIVGRSSFDFLTLYDFAVLYLPEGEHPDTHDPGDWMFVARIAADSGYIQGEPDLTRFSPPKECGTLIRLYAYFCGQSHTGNWFTGVFMENEWPPDAGTKEFEHGIRVFGMTVPLSEMSSREAVRQHVTRFMDELRKVFPERATW
jgi:hypothetical protein